MAIKQIYPTNILVEQLDIPEEVIYTVEVYLKAQNKQFKSDSSHNHIEYRDGNENIVVDAIEKGECPEMKIIVDEVKKRFVQLAYSNIDSLTESDSEQLILEANIESTKINLMQSGYRLGVHTHYGDDAYGCFYFNDVKKDDGGELVLYDPRWQRNYMFGGSQLETIRPRRGMLVIAPGFIWHEVSQYNGLSERLTLVFNAQVQNLSDEVRVKRTKHTI